MIRCLAGIAILLAAGPLAAQPRHEFTELHMGVAVRLVLHAEDAAAARTAARAAFDRIAALEDILSDYRPHSELRRLERPDTGWVAVSPDLARVLAAARRLASLSDGAFEPTAGPLTALWRETRATGRLPSTAALDNARARVGFEAFTVDTLGARIHLARPNLRFDLGGIAKGYILGQAALVLRHHGIYRALIEAGGDLLLGDPPPGRPGWHIARPEGGPSTLANVAVATSGTGEQWVEIGGVRYAHLVDPRTGLGLTRDVQVTVIGPDPMLADALATAIAVLGEPHSAALRAAFPEYRVRARRSPASPR